MSNMVFTIGSGGIPAGAYTARFVGIEQTPADPAKGYGPGVKWTWEVVGGEHAGLRCHRTTTANPSPKNAAGKIIAGLVGRTIQPGEKVSLEAFVRQVYLVVVAEGPSGGTRVESVTKPAA